MAASIFAQEFTGLLYIMSACLLFLLVKPRLLFAYRRRRMLFLILLLALFAIYLSFESIDPYIYTIHMLPVCLLVTALFEGAMAAVVVWLLFNLGGALTVLDDPVPTLAASAVLTGIALVVHYRSRKRSGAGRAVLQSALLLTVYYAALAPLHDFSYMPAGPSALAAGGGYLSALLVSAVYYHVRNQERMMEELVSAEKYNMVGQLAASISHEVRNPLTTAQGFIQLMNKDDLATEQFERYRAQAIAGIEHANAVISDYLNFANPTVEAAAPLDVAEEIDSLVPWLRPLAAASDVELKIRHLSAEPAIISGESRKLQQCLLNLMKNGIEAMPDGGVLSVETSKDRDGVAIRIEDTGIGMTETQIKRIGLPFFSTKNKGTGLGLMVVISLVHAMGGKITFRSAPHAGTSCTLLFREHSEEGGA